LPVKAYLHQEEGAGVDPGKGKELSKLLKDSGQTGQGKR